MTFAELAGIVGKSSGAVRVAFSRAGWSIASPADISAYLEFVRRPERYTVPRASGSAAHLAAYRFQRSASIERMLPALAEDFVRPDPRDLAAWLRRPRFVGESARLIPEARLALRELARGLLGTSRDLIGIIVTGPHLTETPTRALGVLGVYSWLPGNAELAAVAQQLAAEQSAALGLQVRLLPTDALRLDATLANPANATLRDWLATSRVEYGYATLPL